MRRVMANALVTLLALLLSVGASRGEGIWVSCKVGTLEWSCLKIENTETCKIKPANKSDIQGAVMIPSEVTIDGKTLKVVTVAEEAFSNCTKLSEVSIPEGVETIEESAFSSCEALSTLQLPQSLKVIGEQSFAWCGELASVNIPANVESIGYDAFQNCSKLEKFEVAAGNGHFSEAGGVLFNNDKTALLCYPLGLSADSYDIPTTVKSIGASAFIGNGKLKTVNTAGVTAIGKSAFSGCSVLEKVVVPEGVTTIEPYTFYGCEKLSSVELTKGLTIIGEWVFAGCTSLEKVELPEGLESIEDFAFNGCNKLGSVVFSAGLKKIGGSAFAGTMLKTVALPEGVTSIGEEAFSYCGSLKSVELRKGLTSIGGSAFSGCESLEKVELPEGLTSIGESAFAWSPNLSEVTIPTSVTEIGRGAFSGTALTSVAIPAGVQKLVGTFAPCLNLEKVTLSEGLEVLDGTFLGCEKLTEITIPASVTTIEVGTFSNTALTSCVIPAGVKKLSGAFTDCPNLEKVTLSEGLEVLDGTFSNCPKLTEISIPASVKSIASATFSGCSALNKVYYLAAANATVVDNAFDGIADPATLFVRRGEKVKIEGNGKAWKEKFKVIEERNVVTFDADGGLPTPAAQWLEDGGKAVEPSQKPEKKGFKFEGWTLLSGENYHFGTKVEGNIVLKAKYVADAKPTPAAVESVLLAAARVVQNPIDNALVLEGISTAERIEVYSLAGVQTYAHALRGEERVEIATGSWASGIYVVRIIATDGEKTVRVVKR